MSARLVITLGEHFDKWTVIDAITIYKGNKGYVTCQCECGHIRQIQTYDLRHNKSRSCLRCRRPNNLKHGHKRGGKNSPTRSSWAAMMQRCTNPKNIGWHLYGGKDITVCERWYDFANFLADMGEKPSPAHTIERKDSRLGYAPENCCWLLRSLQNRNRSLNRMLTVHGETALLIDWAARYHIPQSRLRARIRAGWDVMAALTLPLHARHHHTFQQLTLPYELITTSRED